MHTRIIFLDVDGVLNSAATWPTDEAPAPVSGERLNPAMCARLIELARLTDAKIVVSSSWRFCYYDRLIFRLTKYGLPPGTIIGQTPRSESGNRGEEIRLWLDDHSEVDAFVILDDDHVHPFMRHQIQTSWEHGFQDEHFRCAVRLMQRQIASNKA